MSLRHLSDPEHLPALDRKYVTDRPAVGLGPDDSAPRILLLYGSLRERSYSRLCIEDAARLLRLFGCETRIFDPSTRSEEHTSELQSLISISYAVFCLKQNINH